MRKWTETKRSSQQSSQTAKFLNFEHGGAAFDEPTMVEASLDGRAAVAGSS
jgi:hypothetical protein